VHVGLNPLPRLRDPDLQFVQVSLRNDSQVVAVVNGDAAQASVSGQVMPAAGGRYLVHSGRPGMTMKKQLWLLAVGAGSFGFAGPEFYEYITPDQHRKRSLGTAIGIDGTRHQVEAQRFGVRVLMPGDETIGWMAFQCQPEQSIKSVTIPISFSRSLSPDGVLDVPVQSQTSVTTSGTPPTVPEPVTPDQPPTQSGSGVDGPLSR
ncbi:MAG: hypothetical protein ACREMY_25625, partial [bacterium]